VYHLSIATGGRSTPTTLSTTIQSVGKNQTLILIVLQNDNIKQQFGEDFSTFSLIIGFLIKFISLLVCIKVKTAFANQLNTFVGINKVCLTICV
jgi:hypothetical protein